MARRRPLVAAVLCLLAVLAAACGSSRYEFHSNKAAGMYLKVPKGWTRIPDAQLFLLYTQDGKEPSPDGYRLLKSITWERAWDSSSRPSVQHLVLGAADAPVVRANVRTLLPEERQLVSVQELRNLLFAAYDDGVEAYRELLRSPGTSALVNADFEPIQEQELRDDGFFGTRQIFKVRKQDGSLYSLGFIALVDDARTRLMTLTVHCNAQCFAQNGADIVRVLDSFTVRET